MIQSIDLRTVSDYNGPLIPAIKAFYTSAPGTTIQYLISDACSFKDLKVFLSEQNIGFREVYKENYSILEFTKP